MKENEDQEHLLAKGDEGVQSVDWNDGLDIIPANKRSFYVTLILLMASLLANILLLLWHGSPPKCPPDLGKSPYSGNTFDTLVPYHSFTKYWNPKVNESFADEAWDALDTNPIAVALHDDHAKQLGLADSTRFPWDTERSVYYLKGLHDLHCLKLIRKAIVSTQRGEKHELTIEHILHCLDGLRQDIMCTADDTPMPAPKSHNIGDGQIRRCRNWDKMIAWASSPDQNACHQFDDYREASNTLELFAFCPEHSPYRPIMEAYFDYHGHKDAYEVNDGEAFRLR
ncbi:uncharacterized protein BDR25DRAFT_339835 [Lindgomyces ingoldianus]|uniref:Uncharacterized protein n=1 Tax=Lindgomyces ingoldianus TaxID=673940 RepID=A0ACB6RC13_9PLEO|nr:uncharacterized protein BDR25DRAFT_339835 [Lindgomyces ingoldianus]KAF2475867.1 hypothetical protein BDR25DRAFT_339835 [Lindgomyces ingoldianus]